MQSSRRICHNPFYEIVDRSEAVLYETKKVGTCPLVAVVHEKSPLAKLSAMTYDDLNGQRLIFGQPENSPQKQCGIHRLCVEHQVRPESVRYVNSDVTRCV